MQWHGWAGVMRSGVWGRSVRYGYGDGDGASLMGIEMRGRRALSIHSSSVLFSRYEIHTAYRSVAMSLR